MPRALVALSIRRLVSIALVAMTAAGAGLHAAPPEARTAPEELGAVQWRRGFDAAKKAAAGDGKPLLVLFQEVPGCDTCKGYGRGPLSHPLLVEAAETLFVPVAVYNNIKGDDAKTLDSFHESSWANPVVRVLDAEGKDLAPRLADDYTTAGLATTMVKGLTSAGKEVPAYLRLVAEEESARRAGVQRTTLAMHCFWEGEGTLGGIAGVVATSPGVIGDAEVVDVEFDPRTIDFAGLLARAMGSKCADRVFARTDGQLELATKAGVSVVRSDEVAKPDGRPKYYLSQTRLRHLPMTGLQAARVNAALAARTDPLVVLSPRQVALNRVMERHKDARWPEAIGTDFPRAWSEAITAAGSIRK